MDAAVQTHRRLLILVGLIALGTAVGLFLLWPSQVRLPEPPGQAPEQVVDGTVESVELSEGDADPFTGEPTEMATLRVAVGSGPDAGRVVTIETSTLGYPEFNAGDEVKLSRSSGADGITYFVVDFERRSALLWLAALFVLAVLATGGWHGLRSLAGVVVSLMVVIGFVVPAILAGETPALVAVVGALAIMLVNLYLAHGVNQMTTSAVVATACALAFTVGLGVLFIELGELTGYASEEATLAQFTVEGLDLRGLVLAGLIIAALGVLDDVTVTQASTVFALHDTDRTLSGRTLFRRAMRVGRDHIASTVNTLFLAYAGASLALLVLFSTSGVAAMEIVTSEVMAEEIIKIVVGSIGLVAAVPLTTALAAAIAVRRPASAPRERTPVPRPEKDESEMDDEELAHQAWIRFLREGGTPPEQPDDPPRSRS